MHELSILHQRGVQGRLKTATRQHMLGRSISCSKQPGRLLKVNAKSNLTEQSLRLKNLAFRWWTLATWQQVLEMVIRRQAGLGLDTGLGPPLAACWATKVLPKFIGPEVYHTHTLCDVYISDRALRTHYHELKGYTWKELPRTASRCRNSTGKGATFNVRVKKLVLKW